MNARGKARNARGMEPRREPRARLALLAAVLAAAALLPAAARQQERQASPVGLPVRIEDLVLPGGELEVAPQGFRAPIVLRVLAARPHGTAFRYDLEYWGQEPGEYDLGRLLRRKDGSPLNAGGELPPIPVAIRSVLPAGQILPHAPREGGVPAFGGYRVLLAAGGVLWLAGLAAILLAGRRRRAAEAARARPRTLAERLRPLVERALDGRLSRAERAQLELGLVAFWRRKLGLEEGEPEEVLAILREHAEAGPLLRKLEEWLHAPPAASAAGGEVDVAALLAPYRDLPPDEILAEIPFRTLERA